MLARQVSSKQSHRVGQCTSATNRNDPLCTCVSFCQVSTARAGGNTQEAHGLLLLQLLLQLFVSCIKLDCFIWG